MRSVAAGLSSGTARQLRGAGLRGYAHDGIEARVVQCSGIRAHAVSSPVTCAGIAEGLARFRWTSLGTTCKNTENDALAISTDGADVVEIACVRRFASPRPFRGFRRRCLVHGGGRNAAGDPASDGARVGIEGSGGAGCMHLPNTRRASTKGSEPRSSSRTDGNIGDAVRSRPAQDTLTHGGEVPARADAGIAAHGCRSSSKDWVRREGVDEPLSEFALAHVQGSRTVAAYARDGVLE